MTCYWVFDEDTALRAARAWATDYRHDDLSESACRARLDAVRAFLFSRQARALGLLQSAPDDYEGRTTAVITRGYYEF